MNISLLIVLGTFHYKDILPLEIKNLCIYSDFLHSLSRHEYYQKPEEVVVTIFAKHMPSDSIKVDFGEQIVSYTSSIFCSSLCRFCVAN